MNLYQVDAFTDRPFAGNPAAVVPLGEWLPDELLRKIAAENNLSETAFVTPGRDASGAPIAPGTHTPRLDGADHADYLLRWFTPAREVALCGHATLATAHVLFAELTADDPLAPAARPDDSCSEDVLRFATRSGPVSVERDRPGSPDPDLLWLDFPAITAETPTDVPGLAGALGAEPVGVFATPENHPAGGNTLVELASEAELRGLTPDLRALARLAQGCFICTAPAGDELAADGVDFTSRFFAPRFGVDEDPATGSTHATLTPFWSARLGKPRLRARQLSARGGDFHLHNRPDTPAGPRVGIGGRTVTVLRGEYTNLDV